MTSVTLASASRARAALLRAAGVELTLTPAALDEAALTLGLVAEGAGPAAIAETLAEAKAVKVSRRSPGLVLGADQTLDLDGALLEKPATRADAAASLRALRGREHRLHTAAVAAIDGRPVWRVCKTARLVMRPLSDAFIQSYLDLEGEDVMGCVGAYRFEARGAQLFSEVDGDYFTILGFPLIEALDLLRRYGVLPL